MRLVRLGGGGPQFPGCQISRCVFAEVARGSAKPLTLLLLLINEPLASNVLLPISRETERRRSWRSLIDEHRYAPAAAAVVRLNQLLYQPHIAAAAVG